MKKIILLSALLLITVSCEKTKTQDFQIPSWLQERINQDEKIIKADPRSGLDIAAWIRYEYKGKHFYEYVNWLSSAGTEIYQSDGTRFNRTEDNIIDYQSNKCCKYYIWRGPSFFDLDDY